ncbi:hypothetical protein VNO80_10771 [Phaseolus coccineus]|uniref:Uncharacterized protein n=1 Tax=Phaseolus coccineus TaxID=3886 RepID=A0AAN9NAD8_PHACN
MAVEKEKLQEESVIRRFYQIILSWDYFALLKEFKKQKNSEKKGTAKSTLVKLQNWYTDVDDYIATYEPLIFDEAKSQIIKEKEEEEDDFHFIEFPCEINVGESISQNDLLLLSKDKFVDGKRLPTVYAFALLCSLSTIAWEYLAIRTIGCLPYKDLILSAVGENCGTEVEGWKIPTPLRE